MNIILSASIFDAFVQNKPAAFINKANSRQLLSEAVGRVKNGTSQINIGTLPYLRQLSPLPSEIRNIHIPDELISKTAFYMSYSAFRAAQQKTTWNSVVWLAQQLRPSSAFSGDILQADEEPGHILANIPSDFNELTDKYGNPLKPEDYWLERISYSIRTPTQLLPLGYHAGSGADGLMSTRYDVSDYLSFAITSGKLNSAYSTFSEIEARNIVPLSNSVVSANVSMNPDQMLAVDQLAELALLTLGAELGLAGEQKRVELDRRADDYLDVYDRNRLAICL